LVDGKQALLLVRRGRGKVHGCEHLVADLLDADQVEQRCGCFPVGLGCLVDQNAISWPCWLPLSAVEPSHGFAGQPFPLSVMQAHIPRVTHVRANP